MTLFTYTEHQKVVDNCFLPSPKTAAGNSFSLNITYKFYKARKTVRTGLAYLYLLAIYPSIMRIQYQFRKDGGFAGPFQWLRLEDLVRLVKKFRPTSILECGSGTSTALFATLCPGRLTVLEHIEEWKRVLMQAVGGLRDKMNIIRADQKIILKDDETVNHYDVDHKQYYDFVYVDGPSNFALSEAGYTKIKDPQGLVPDVDVELMWENGIFPRFIVIDGRRTTVRRLMMKGKDRYNTYLKTDFYFIARMPSLSKYQFHTVMIRKDADKRRS